MIRDLKRRLIYSYAGVAAGGAVLFVMTQLISLFLRKEWVSSGDLLRMFAVLSFLVTVFLAVSGISLLRHEGFGTGNLIGVAFGTIWTAGNLFCLLLMKYFPGMHLAVRFAAVSGCFVDFLISGILLMALIAARHKPAYDKDFVIIPGCSISKRGGLLPLLKGRTNRAIRFAWDQERSSGKPARYIPTGGQGPDEVMSEGSAMEFYLLTHGAEQYEVFPEKASVNTWENMLFSKRIIEELMPKAKVCFVTTNYHVLRSGMLAGKAGLDAEGLASSTKWYFWPNATAREVIGILSMYPLQHAAAAVICLAAAWMMSIRI